MPPSSSHIFVRRLLALFVCFHLLLFVIAGVVSAEKDDSLAITEQSEEFAQPNFNLLSSKHLLIIPSEFPQNLELKRDSNGIIVSVTGPSADILHHLALSLNFTYEYYMGNDLPKLTDNANLTNPAASKIGFFINTNADVMLGAFGYHAKRNQVIDYPYNILTSRMALMIPAFSAQKRNYIVFVWQPFQLPVWIGVIISLIIGVTSLYLISLGFSKIQLKKETAKKGLCDASTNESTRFRKALNFTFGLIVFQGSASSQALGRSRQLAILLLAGAWCLVCFVLVTAYSSVVISFLTAPETFKPIINSINDLPMKPEIKVTVTKGWATDVIFQSAVSDDDKSSAIFKFLGQELKKHPDQRCAIVDKCIEKVREGSSVYIFEDTFIENLMMEDLKKTNRCDFATAKEKFLLALASGFLLQKNSPYTKYFSLQLMRMEASGLLKFWQKQAGRDSLRRCLKNSNFKGPKGNRRDDEKKPLTLKGLSGAFIILGFGYSLGIAVFIIEMCQSHIKNRNVVKPGQVKTNKTDKTVLIKDFMIRVKKRLYSTFVTFVRTKTKRNEAHSDMGKYETASTDKAVSNRDKEAVSVAL